MNVIHICKKIESETLHLPELRPLIGKTVQIIVQEANETGVSPGTGDWEAAARAAQQLRESGYDFGAGGAQREYDLKHANDHLP